MDGKLCSSGEGGTDGKDLPLYVHVCVVPPMIVGACMCMVDATVNILTSLWLSL